MFGTGLLNAFARGVKMKIVADKGSSRKGFDFTWVTVRKDLIDEGKVKTPCDLKGRKIGVASVQSGAEINVALALAQCNLTVKDVELMVMTFPDIVVAYKNKAIDAAFQAEPHPHRSGRPRPGGPLEALQRALRRPGPDGGDHLLGALRQERGRRKAVHGRLPKGPQRLQRLLRKEPGQEGDSGHPGQALPRQRPEAL